MVLEKDVFCLVMNMGQRKMFSPHEELNLRPSHSYALPLSHKDSVVSMANTKLICDSSCELRIVFFFLCSLQDEKHICLFLYQAQNWPSFIFYLIM